MRQKTHSHEDRGLDEYYTPAPAILSLIDLEREHIPRVVLEPACGAGNIVIPLRAAGYRVVASDITYGRCPEMIGGVDFLAADGVKSAPGVVTNPPFRIAREFIERCLEVSPYTACLLPLGFLAGTRRRPWHETSPLARVWVSSRRLPMMHREGWDGPKASSAVDFAWFIWSRGHIGEPAIRWFDWKEICGNEPMACDESASLDRASETGGGGELDSVEAAPGIAAG